MSEKQLKKIEDLLTQVCQQQQDLCGRMEQLEGRVAKVVGEPTCEETVGFLDQYRSLEADAANWIGAWIDATDLDCVKGGLRTVQQREASHAQLLEERIKELGGSCTAEVPKSDREQMLKTYGGCECSDVEKISSLLEQVGDVEVALKPYYDFANRLDGDQQTQFLLRTIMQDERSSLQFLKDACALLS